MRMRRDFLLWAVMAAGILVNAPAFPGDETKPAAAPGKASGTSLGPRISGAKLRQCVAIDIELDQHKSDKKRHNRSLGEARDAAKEARRKINMQRRGLDHKDHAAVAAFNEHIEDLGRLDAIAESRRLAFNEVVDAHNAVVERFNRNCEGVIYTEKDWQTEKHRQNQAAKSSNSK